VVVANLETAKLRGLESQGMLLAASDDGRVIILTPEKQVLAGAQVK
jgi:methionyl-tRNA synthetase